MSKETPPRQLRLFIAVELPGNVRQLIGECIGELKQALPTTLKWVQPQSVHLTLKFLGNVTEGQVPATIEALKTLSIFGRVVSLQTGSLGCFPHSRSPRVIWLGLEGDLEDLAQLQRYVKDTMASLDYRREDRPFKPHLTLARSRDKVNHSMANCLEDLLNKKPQRKEGFTVEKVSLMQSTLTPKGAIYTQIVSVSLLNTEN